MSSNSYGFETYITWNDRIYNIQIVLTNTGYDDSETLEYADSKLEELGISTRDPVELATREISDRDWSNKFNSEYIRVWGIYPRWKDEDPEDPLWNPPKPTERDVLELIAAGEFSRGFAWDWDT